MADATLNSLAQFSDPSRWVVVRSVPIFREHISTLPDGKPFPIDQNELTKFAAELQRLEQKEGVLARLTLGHTLSKNPKTGEEPREVDQPPVVGYARNAHVGLYGPSQNPAVLSDFWYRREDWEKAKEFPYRSPEVYLNSRQITGVALLKRDPKLDMGMTIFQHDKAPAVSLQQPKSYYQRDDGVQFYALDDEATHYGLESGLVGLGAGMDLAEGRSAKNTAGRAAGGLLGAKAGMALGTAALTPILGPAAPLGAAALGGIGGQMVGDKISQDACGTMPKKMADDASPEGAQAACPCGQTPCTCGSTDIDSVLSECLQSLQPTSYRRESNMANEERTDYTLASTLATAGGKIGAGLTSAGKWAGTHLGDAGKWVAANPGKTAAGVGLAGTGFVGGRMSKNADDVPPEGAAPAPETTPGPEAGGDPMAAMQDQLAQLAPEEFAQLLQHLTEMYKQAHGAGGAAPEAAAPPAAPQAPEEVPQPMHRSNGNMARYERENIQLRNAVIELQHKVGSAEREKIVHSFHEELRDMDRQGWVVTDRDFERVVRMSREGFEEYKEVLKEHGARHHGNDQLIPLASEGTDADLPSDRERAVLYQRHQEQKGQLAEMDRHDKVIQYMRVKGCDYDAANAAFDKNGRLIKVG